jgi:sigma-54 specific flagellar transcriptional regulator A
MRTSGKVWVVDDDRSIRWVLEKALGSAGVDTQVFESADELIRRLEREQPDAIISDIRMPGTDGLELLRHLQQVNAEMPIIIMTAHSDLDSAVASYQGGAFEYLPKPFDVDEAVALVKRAIEHANERKEKVTEQEEDASAEIIGEAPAMQEVFRAIGRLSHSNITVLINGESGTGKELVAHALHRHSPRSARPFIPLNMAAIPKDLIESELFGHEKGAFTGAINSRPGRFEMAEGGTLFLDEIGDMPLNMQVKILRVLQEHTFERVGSNKTINANVRIIAATHKNLETMIEDGSFREDLYYRLNVFPIDMPSLRERVEDLPLLLNELISRLENEKRGSIRFNSAAIMSLCRHDWHGNVRELANLVERLAILHPYGVVGVNELPKKFRHVDDGDESLALPVVADVTQNEGLAGVDSPALLPVNGLDLREYLQDLECSLIQQALDDSNGVVARAAEKLNIRRTTLVEKMRKYDLQRKEKDTA